MRGHRAHDDHRRTDDHHRAADHDRSANHHRRTDDDLDDVDDNDDHRGTYHDLDNDHYDCTGDNGCAGNYRGTHHNIEDNDNGPEDDHDVDNDNDNAAAHHNASPTDIVGCHDPVVGRFIVRQWSSDVRQSCLDHGERAQQRQRDVLRQLGCDLRNDLLRRIQQHRTRCHECRRVVQRPTGCLRTAVDDQ